MGEVAATAPKGVSLQEAQPGTSLWQDGWHRLKRNRMAMFSLWFLVGMTLFCYILPLFYPYDYATQQRSLGAQAPSWDHWMGTDYLGRDVLARVMFGGRISLGVGLLATLVSISIGVVYGATAAYKGGRTDSVMMRFVDILYAMPYAIFVILLMVWLGRNLVLLFLALGAVQWLTMARIVRAQVMSLKAQEFVEAAIVLGLRPSRILFRHILPNLLGVVIVYATLTVPAIMLLEAFLSFLGLGVQPPMASWGVLIKDGADSMTVFPWLLIFPALVFSSTLFALNFLGDGLRDALDPKSSSD